MSWYPMTATIWAVIIMAGNPSRLPYYAGTKAGCHYQQQSPIFNCFHGNDKLVQLNNRFAANIVFKF
jgi:hypothetical protein